MNEQYASILDILLLQLFLGSIVYLIGSAIFFFILRKTRHRNSKIILLLFIQFCFSILLSLIVWKNWIINIDIMVFEFINLPAMFSEFITISICSFIFRKTE